MDRKYRIPDLASIFLAPLLLAGCVATSTPLRPVPSDTPAPTATRDVVLYRGDAQRSGAYDLPALRQFTAVKWQKNLGAQASFGAPVYADGVLYVGGQDGMLYALDAESGDEVWVTNFGSLMSAVAIDETRVFAGGWDGHVRAFDRETGDSLWSFATQGSAWGSPLVIDQTVYAVSERGVYALEVATGELVWQVEGRPYQGFVGGAAYSDGSLYAALSRTLLAIDVTSGEIQWQIDVGRSFYGIAISDDVLYAGNDDGTFYAFDQQNGEVRWKFMAGDGWSAAAIANGVIYVGNIDQHIYALDAQTGAELWRFETEDWATSDPIESDGVVYVGVGNHMNREGKRHLYAIDAESGEALWAFEAASRLLTAPAIGPDGIFIISIGGDVYALH